ncbi:MAG TPA: CHAT domain-containing tetratricopeptide repeat protein [Thermoanaerobaculia bacterium]|nr:CHAT domain-containing tetratricopeptide repeat protein [Thermoanaerobaculia bacterium]
MTCSCLIPLPPRLFGVRRLLVPALLAAVGLGGAACRPHKPSETVVYRYPIDLKAGEFVRAVVKQKVDVRVDLLDPDDREVLHVDGPNSTRDDEEIAAVAERPGTYRLKVLSCPRRVARDDCYTLRLDRPRPATGADRRRAEAVRVSQQAADAMLTNTEESWKHQLAIRERALALWTGLGDRGREAEELFQLGSLLHGRLHQSDAAARRFHRAAGIWASLGDPFREAKALNQAGRTCRDLGHLDDALGDFRRALAKARQAGDCRQLGNILNNLGLFLNSLGQRQEARRHLIEALDLALKLGSDVGRPANIMNNLGLIYADLGDPQRAIKLGRKALAFPGANALEKAAAYNNLGTVYASLGDWVDAVENYDQAIAINRHENDLYHLTSTLNNLGEAQHYSGDLEAAQRSYQEALVRARETKNLDVQIQASNNFGLLLDQKLGRTEEALAQWREVDRLAASRPVLDYVGLAARAAVERGEKKLSAARGTLQEAIARSRKRADLRFAAELTLRLARVEQELGDLDAAAGHAQIAVASIESLRNRVVSLDQRALFLASNQTFYELYLQLLMELHEKHPTEGYDTRALKVSEQERARSLLDLLGVADSDLHRGVPQRVLDDERTKRARLRDLDLQHMELIHRGASRQQVTEAAARLNQAVAEFAEVEAELRASSVSYAALTPQPLDVHEIQNQVLGDQTLLLEYALGEERSYVWAVTPGTVQSFALPPRREIEAAARDFYQAITSKDDARADRAGLTLSRMILGPVEPLLGDHLLLVVGDGVLQYVPFTALPLPSSPGQRVLARNEVVSLPSASTLAALRRQVEGRPPAPKTLAVLADPVFQLGDSRLHKIEGMQPSPVQLAAHRGPNGEEDQLVLRRLPFADEEAKSIVALKPDDPGQVLDARGFAASYRLATSGKLAEFRYIHFATHGLLNSQQPYLSKLALSQFREDGQRQDESFLRLADIYKLSLNADLVVLSACQTALGKEVKGEGLVGLTRGFMYAGSPRVLASLWSVDDFATAELMKHFYRYLLVDKRPPAEALRRAQLDIAAMPRFRSLYDWAGFSLQGEWK